MGAGFVARAREHQLASRGRELVDIAAQIVGPVPVVIRAAAALMRSIASSTFPTMQPTWNGLVMSNAMVVLLVASASKYRTPAKSDQGVGHL